MSKLSKDITLTGLILAGMEIVRWVFFGPDYMGLLFMLAMMLSFTAGVLVGKYCYPDEPAEQWNPNK